jgi:hypothetical protein
VGSAEGVQGVKVVGAGSSQPARQILHSYLFREAGPGADNVLVHTFMRGQAVRLRPGLPMIEWIRTVQVRQPGPGNVFCGVSQTFENP